MVVGRRKLLLYRLRGLLRRVRVADVLHVGVAVAHVLVLLATVFR
jgi:hypothetical protein